MAFFAVFVPVIMLGVMVALGRYEELMLPTMRDEPAASKARSPGPIHEPASRGPTGTHDASRDA